MSVASSFRKLYRCRFSPAPGNCCWKACAKSATRHACLPPPMVLVRIGFAADLLNPGRCRELLYDKRRGARKRRKRAVLTPARAGQSLSRRPVQQSRLRRSTPPRHRMRWPFRGCGRRLPAIIAHRRVCARTRCARSVSKQGQIEFSAMPGGSPQLQRSRAACRKSPEAADAGIKCRRCRRSASRNRRRQDSFVRRARRGFGAKGRPLLFRTRSAAQRACRAQIAAVSGEWLHARLCDKGMIELDGELLLCPHCAATVPEEKHGCECGWRSVWSASGQVDVWHCPYCRAREHGCVGGEYSRTEDRVVVSLGTNGRLVPDPCQQCADEREAENRRREMEPKAAEPPSHGERFDFFNARPRLTNFEPCRLAAAEAT